MIALRDARARDLDLDLIVHTNRDGVAQASARSTTGRRSTRTSLKTQALRQALDAHKFTVTANAVVKTIRNRIDPETGRSVPAGSLGANDIGEITLQLDREVAVDA